IALALLSVIIAGSRTDVLVDEGADPVAPVRLGGPEAEIHGAPLSVTFNAGYVPRMQRLAGKVVIVTGAASGIGKATVELFRSQGAVVVGADIGEGADVQADAGSEEDVRRLVEDTEAKLGGLDIVVANAGISGGFSSIS